MTHLVRLSISRADMAALAVPTHRRYGVTAPDAARALAAALHMALGGMRTSVHAPRQPREATVFTGDASVYASAADYVRDRSAYSVSYRVEETSAVSIGADGHVVGLDASEAEGADA